MGQAIVIKAGGKDFEGELNDSVTAGAFKSFEETINWLHSSGGLEDLFEN
jgi:hypothetical protein